MKRRYAQIVIVLALIGTGLVTFGNHAVSTHQSEPIMEANYILDAGHGGEDGGAVSVTGVSESEINLEIVLRMDVLMGFLGEPARLVRVKDISLHNEEAQTLREKKVSDLKNRVAIAHQMQKATLVSIHQNTYPDGKYHGTHVFYAPTEGSQELAEIIQEAVVKTLQPENNRQAKQIPDTVYLMNRISNRAVLVECGFLTNPKEEAQLRSEGYQKKLAAVITSALLTGC